MPAGIFGAWAPAKSKKTTILLHNVMIIAKRNACGLHLQLLAVVIRVASAGSFGVRRLDAAFSRRGLTRHRSYVNQGCSNRLSERDEAVYWRAVSSHRK